MDLRNLFVRPASQLLSPLRLLASSKTVAAAPLPLIPSRGHKTTTRTKRALKIAPHDSFLPSRTSSAAADSIIYNPPSSEASPEHTPFIFLPRSDPRRQAILRLRSSGNDPTAYNSSSSVTAESDLPPEMRYKRRQPKYTLTKEHIEEMRRLRAEDPLTWSVQKLARKFECSTVFVQMAAPAPAEHLQWLKAKMERKMERWGPKRTQAREDRKRRAEMLYRGEL